MPLPSGLNKKINLINKIKSEVPNGTPNPYYVDNYVENNQESIATDKTQFFRKSDQDIMKKLDKNNDGILSERELKNASQDDYFDFQEAIDFFTTEKNLYSNPQTVKELILLDQAVNALSVFKSLQNQKKTTGLLNTVATTWVLLGLQGNAYNQQMATQARVNNAINQYQWQKSNENSILSDKLGSSDFLNQSLKLNREGINNSLENSLKIKIPEPSTSNVNVRSIPSKIPKQETVSWRPNARPQFNANKYKTSPTPISKKNLQTKLNQYKQFMKC